MLMLQIIKINTFKKHKMKSDFIVFQGKEFTVEWYFNRNGKRIALEYYARRSPNKSNELI